MALDESSVLILPDTSSLDIAPLSGGSQSVTMSRGVALQIGVRVSGAGAYARLRGTLSLNHRRLETSSEYNSLRSEFRFSGGARSFFRWIGGNINVGGNRQRINETFNQLQRNTTVNGEAKFDLWVTGLQPNFPVEAFGFIRLMRVQILDEVFWVISDGNSRDDTGGSDRDGSELPDKDNDSEVIFF
jgi:hypothetical protein